MLPLFVALIAALRFSIRSRLELEAEILALRHQLAVLRAVIRQMQAANPLWGAPRVHSELQTLGITIARATVAKCLGRRPLTPPSQTWRTFLTNHISQVSATSTRHAGNPVSRSSTAPDESNRERSRTPRWETPSGWTIW